MYAVSEPYAAPPAPVASRVEASVPKGRTKPQVAPEAVAKAQPIPKAEAAVAAAPGVAARGQSRPEAETITTGQASFSIAISVSPDEVRVGSDVPVRITLRNVSNRQIVFGHRPGVNNPEFSYAIEVRNAKGQMVEETAYGREATDARRRQEEDRTVDYVQPGGSSVQTAHLAKLVSLSRPGWYTVRVSRKDAGSGEVVRSNEVKFALVP